MTDNEQIAEWLGWTKFKTDSFMWMWNKPGETGSSNALYCPPLFNFKITLWHGEDGLLVEIDKHGLVDKFVDAVYETVECGTFAYSSNPAEHKFAFLMLSAGQLTAALVAVIKEE